MKNLKISLTFAFLLYSVFCFSQQGEQEQNFTNKEPVNLGEKVNSSANDYGPKIDPAGKKLYFTSKRESSFGYSNENLYTVDIVNDEFKSAQLLPEPINSDNNEGLATFSADGQTMIYVKCNSTDGFGNCDLYFSQLKGYSWSPPVNMGDSINSADWESQPCLSADGMSLYFCSINGEGFGNSDIYVSTKRKDGRWGKPKNLGNVINTSENDLAPYIASDGQTLYFSSMGHEGLGGYDTFKSSFENGEWTKPVNLGPLVNTSGDDKYFSITASGKYAYFSSARSGGNGLSDLYRIELAENLRPQTSIILTGFVRDEVSKEPLGAQLLLKNVESGELISQSESNSKTGTYTTVLPTGGNYNLSVELDGYVSSSQSFEIEENAQYEEMNKDVFLTPLEKPVMEEIVKEEVKKDTQPALFERSAAFEFQNVFFETAKADISEESKLELDKMVDLMKNILSVKIEIEGHTDNVGSDESNMKLSLERANAVKNYLANAGIATERLQVKGYGEKAPAESNDSEEGRAANRRTEFKVLDN